MPATQLETNQLLDAILAATTDGREKIASGYFDTATVNDKFASASIALSKLAEAVIQADGGQAFTADQSMGGFKLTNLADPTGPQDAATRQFVEDFAVGLSDWKSSVRVATTSNLVATRSGNVLTADANGSINTAGIDGITDLALNARVLVKNQSTPADNGFYYISDLGSAGTPYELTRTEDADTSAEVTTGAYVYVEEGTTNGTSSWVLSTSGTITLNTTGLTFTQFNGAAQITAGSGLTKTGNTLNVNAGDTSITANADDIVVNLNTTGGLETSSGVRVKLDGNTLARGASGLKFTGNLDGNILTDSAGGNVEVAAASTKDIDLRMGDASGTNKVSFRDSADAEVAQIDSDGNFDLSGDITMTGGGSITTTSNGNITIDPNGTGEVTVADTLLRIGEGNDDTITIYAQNADTDKPALRYNASTNVWELSNNGTTFSAIATAAGAFDGDLFGNTLTDTSGGNLELAAAASKDIDIKMGDAAGAFKTAFRDSADALVFEINSNGGLVSYQLAGSGNFTLTFDVGAATTEPAIQYTDGTGWQFVNEDGTMKSFQAAITAGDALSFTGDTLNVNVDNATVEVSGDALQLKDAGTTEAKLHANVLLRLAETVLDDSVSPPTATASKGFVDGTGAQGAVTAQSSPDSTVQVATGGIAYNHQGKRIVFSSSSSIGTFDAPGSGNTSHDIVVLTAAGTFAIRAGTPATSGSQVDPTLTAGDVPLARVVLVGTDATVNTGDITDLRERKNIDGSKLLAGSVSGTAVGTATLTWTNLDTTLRGRLGGFDRREDFTGDGSTANFDLAVNDADLTGGGHQVFKGLLQREGATHDYQTSDNGGAGGVDRISFNTAPGNGTNVSIFYNRTGATP